MHEIGMLHQAAELAISFADENGIGEIKAISIEIGELSGALPYVFTEYFPFVAEKYPQLKNTELKLRTIPGEALCSDCHCLYNVMKHEGVCPRCGSRVMKVLGGQDVNVVSIEY